MRWLEECITRAGYHVYDRRTDRGRRCLQLEDFSSFGRAAAASAAIRGYESMPKSIFSTGRAQSQLIRLALTTAGRSRRYAAAALLKTFAFLSSPWLVAAVGL